MLVITNVVFLGLLPSSTTMLSGTYCLCAGADADTSAHRHQHEVLQHEFVQHEFAQRAVEPFAVQASEMASHGVNALECNSCNGH